MMKERLLKVLRKNVPKIDFEKERKLLTNKIMDSYTTLSVVSMIEDEFDIEFAAEDLIPENLDSIDSILCLIETAMNNKD